MINKLVVWGWIFSHLQCFSVARELKFYFESPSLLIWTFVSVDLSLPSGTCICKLWIVKTISFGYFWCSECASNSFSAFEFQLICNCLIKAACQLFSNTRIISPIFCIKANLIVKKVDLCRWGKMEYHQEEWMIQQKQNSILVTGFTNLRLFLLMGFTN